MDGVMDEELESKQGGPLLPAPGGPLVDEIYSETECFAWIWGIL
jgi:hypothetical protein